MRIYTKTVKLGKDSIYIYDDKGNPVEKYDVAQLTQAAKEGKPVGRLNVIVRTYKDGFKLTGDAVAVEVDDITQSLDEVNERLALDLGEIKAISKKDPVRDDYVIDQPMNLAYVLNHGGLALAYGDAFKNVFAKNTGVRASKAEIDASYNWALDTNQPNLIRAKDPNTLIRLYRESLKGPAPVEPEETGSVDEDVVEEDLDNDEES